eukprot:1158741-Pelagomonas_calceolata.AAC.8
MISNESLKGCWWRPIETRNNSRPDCGVYFRKRSAEMDKCSLHLEEGREMDLGGRKWIWHSVSKCVPCP